MEASKSESSASNVGIIPDGQLAGTEKLMIHVGTISVISLNSWGLKNEVRLILSRDI